MLLSEEEEWIYICLLYRGEFGDSKLLGVESAESQEASPADDRRWTEGEEGLRTEL